MSKLSDGFVARKLRGWCSRKLGQTLMEWRRVAPNRFEFKTDGGASGEVEFVKNPVGKWQVKGL